MSAPPAQITEHFSEPHMTAKAALAYLRRRRPPPAGYSWEDARVVEQTVGPRGVTFRFVFRSER